MASVQSNRNLVAALSYLLGFVTGIVILLVEKDDKFVRFHAWQSTVATGGLFVASIVVSLISSSVKILSIISNFINILFWLLIVVVIFISFVRAYKGQIFKWPIAGDFSEKQVK